VSEQRPYPSRFRDWFALGFLAGLLYQALRNPGSCACCLVLLLVLLIVLIVALVALVQALWWLIVLIALGLLAVWVLRQALVSYDRRKARGLPADSGLVLRDVGHEALERFRRFWVAQDQWSRRHRFLTIVLVLAVVLIVLQCT
jgi:hypothetical protein